MNSKQEYVDKALSYLKYNQNPNSIINSLNNSGYRGEVQNTLDRHTKAYTDYLNSLQFYGDSSGLNPLQKQIYDNAVYKAQMPLGINPGEYLTDFSNRIGNSSNADGYYNNMTKQISIGSSPNPSEVVEFGLHEGTHKAVRDTMPNVGLAKYQDEAMAVAGADSVGRAIGNPTNAYTLQYGDGSLLTPRSAKWLSDELSQYGTMTPDIAEATPIRPNVYFSWGQNPRDRTRVDPWGN